MSRTDIILLAIAAYVAVMTLVRLMKTRRDALVADVQRQVEARRQKKRPQSPARPQRRLTRRLRLSCMKLYIETVGCQMNVLDSELVVASLRKDGYELTASPHDADTILFNTCSVRQHAEDKIYSALGRLKNAKREHPDKVIGVLGCMAQKDQELIFKRAPYVDLIVGPGQLHQVPELVREIREQRGGTQRMEVSLGRKDGSRDQIERSHESYDPLRDPAMRPTPFQAYVRIRSAATSSARTASCPASAAPSKAGRPQHILAEVAPTRRRRLQGNHAPRPDRQQLPLPRRRPHLAAERPARRAARDRRHRADQVRHQLPEGHDERPAGRRPRPAEGAASTCTCPCRAARTTCCKRMKRGYTVEEYREMLARTREWMPGVAVTSDFIVGFCGETDDEFQLTMRPGPRVPLQEQLHLQVQRTARHEGRRAVRRRRAGRSQTPPQQRAARPAERNQRSGQPRLPRPTGDGARRRPEQSSRKARAADDADADASLEHPPRSPRSNSPAAPTATGSSSSTATAAKSATPCRSSSTTPTPTRCSAKSSRGTSGQNCSIWRCRLGTDAEYDYGK